MSLNGSKNADIVFNFKLHKVLSPSVLQVKFLVYKVLSLRLLPDRKTNEISQYNISDNSSKLPWWVASKVISLLAIATRSQTAHHLLDYFDQPFSFLTDPAEVRKFQPKKSLIISTLGLLLRPRTSQSEETKHFRPMAATTTRLVTISYDNVTEWR